MYGIFWQIFQLSPLIALNINKIKITSGHRCLLSTFIYVSHFRMHEWLTLYTALMAHTFQVAVLFQFLMHDKIPRLGRLIMT